MLFHMKFEPALRKAFVGQQAFDGTVIYRKSNPQIAYWVNGPAKLLINGQEVSLHESGKIKGGTESYMATDWVVGHADPENSLRPSPCNRQEGA
jgi:hypothetical protein